MTTFKRQLQLSVAVIVLLTLLLSSALHAYINTEHSRENALNALQSQLNVVAYNLLPAIYFSDSDEAVTILQGLQIQDNILGAAIYAQSALGEPHSSAFAATGILLHKPQFSAERFRVERGLVFSLTPIVSEGDRVGVLYVEARIPQMADVLLDTLKLAAVVMLLCSIVAGLLITFLTRGLSAPITELVNVADRIVSSRRWSLRAPETEYEELKQLGHSFNRILASIEDEIVERKQRQLELDSLNRTLEDKVVQRTLALEEGNRKVTNTLLELERSQRQLVQREKMAGLGELVAGVAHEINTPVGISITATSHVMDNTRQLQRMFDQNQLTRQQLADYLAMVRESGEIALRNLDRAAELVRSFKLVAVDQSSEERRRFNLYTYLEEVIASLKPRLKKSQHQILISGDRDIEINGQPGMFAQLITNMVLNSLLHGFDSEQSGRIEIDISMRADGAVDGIGNGVEEPGCRYVVLRYADNGSGVSEAVMARLFDPFFTTKRQAGGSGLGTHIIYNIATHGLGGTISAFHGQPSGLVYEVTFPLQRQGGSAAA